MIVSSVHMQVFLYRHVTCKKSRNISLSFIREFKTKMFNKMPHVLAKYPSVDLSLSPCEMGSLEWAT